jgi:hypothetical protein
MAEQEDRLTERRRFARLRREFLVRVVRAADSPSPSPAAPTASSPAEVTGTNISFGGVALETEEAHPVGSILSLEILLPQEEPREAMPCPAEPSRRLTLLRAECQVMWCKQATDGRFSVGLRFLKLGEEQFKALSRILDEEIE